jgi:hypothetical protein
MIGATSHPVTWCNISEAQRAHMYMKVWFLFPFWCSCKIAESNYYFHHVRPSTWNNSAPTGQIFVKSDMSIFQKYVKKIQVSLRSDKNNGYFTWRCMYVYDNILPNSSYNEKCFSKSCREYQKHILCSITFFKKNCAVWDIQGKYGRAGQATEDNTVHVIFMLVN